MTKGDILIDDATEGPKDYIDKIRNIKVNGINIPVNKK